MRILMLAPPGAGKGTQGELLAAHFGIPHIASGDLLRSELENETEIGKKVQSYLAAGDLVPDELIESMMADAVVAAARSGGYLLDGFPRTVHQATAVRETAIAEHAEAQAVLHLSVPDQVLVERLTARQRGADDKAETVRHRLAVYHEETEPLVAYYRGRGILHEIDGDQPVEAVTNACLAALATVPGLTEPAPA